MPNSNIPRKILKRKLLKLKYNEDFFEANRFDFKPSFLAKSATERSGVLSKHYRKTIRSYNRLLTLNNLAIKVFDSERIQNKLVILEKIYVESHGIYRSLLGDAAKIFSDDYKSRIGFSRSNQAENEHMEKFHGCVHLMLNIRSKYAVLK